MRAARFGAVLALLVICFSMLSLAERNKFGVSDTQRIAFSKAVKVGDAVLPKGEYKVQHTMQGNTHIMVFERKGGGTPLVVRVQCTLIPLQAAALENETRYILNDKKQRVLQALIFRGDKARHQFTATGD